MAKDKTEGNSPSMNILKMPFYLLAVCGHTLSTDGVTISRSLVVYSGAIYILNLVLIIMNSTCFDKEDDFESPEVAENICSVTYQIALQIVVSFFLYSSVKKFPKFMKKLEKLELSIKDGSLQKEIHSSVKRIAIIGFACSLTLTIGMTSFTFLVAMNTLEKCPKHKWFVSTEKQHYYGMRLINAFTVFIGFQCIAGLTFMVSLCKVVTMHFKHLGKQLTENAEPEMDVESMANTVQEFTCDPVQIRRIRILYEDTCDLTVKLDEGISMPLGTVLLVMIPFICFLTYSTFFPEFRSDLLFYSLFSSCYCLVVQLAAANLNSQVRFFLPFTKRRIIITNFCVFSLYNFNRCNNGLHLSRRIQ